LFTLAVRSKDIPAPDPVPPTKHLEDRKAVIYENLRDLQFEYRVGKLSDADYQQTKLTLQQELATVLAEIDRIKAASPAPPAAAKASEAKPAPAAKSKPDPLKCPHCGAKMPKQMKFCGECGKAMA